MTAPTAKLNARQVGAHLGVPHTWILAEARANRIPHVRLGKYVRFDLDDIEAWWEARKQGPQRSAEHARAA